MLNILIGSLFAAAKADLVVSKQEPSTGLFVHCPLPARNSNVSAFSIRIFIDFSLSIRLTIKACRLSRQSGVHPISDGMFIAFPFICFA